MKKGWFLVGIIFLLVPWLLVGCGISEEVYNAVVAERDEAQAQVITMQSDLNKLQAEVSSLKSDLSKVQDQVAKMENDLNDAQSEHEAFKSDLTNQWDLLFIKLSVWGYITDYWNDATWASIDVISEEEFTEAVGIFLSETGSPIAATEDPELIQYWRDFIYYSGQENVYEATASLASLTDRLLYDLLGEDIEAMNTKLSD